MAEEGKNRGVASNLHSQHQQFYGTFQGVANHYPPQPPHPVVGFPQPVAPPQGLATPDSQYYYPHGYHSTVTVVPGYALIDGRPVRERRLPCCGMGMGWFLFIVGFFLGGIPWYVGTFILLSVQVDYREKPGYVACAIVSILAVIAVILGAAKGAHAW